MARPDKWMPLYWADFWKDTAHLSEQEGWAYINLIGAYWTNAGPLPMDNARLQRLSRCSPKIWEKVKATVIVFFQRDNDCLRHKRIDRELATTADAYEKRRAHMENVNAKRRQSKPQSLSTVTVDNNCEQSLSRNLQPHSPNGDNHPSDDLGKPRPSRIPEAWKPSEKDIAYAADRKLDPQTITNVAEQFVNHWRAKPSKNTSLDWSRQWRTWINNHIAFHGTGPYPFASKRGPKVHNGDRPSVAAARDRILAKAGISPNTGLGTNPLRDIGTSGAESFGGSGEDFRPLIDADEWQRMPGPIDGNESPDTTVSGDDGGPGSSTDGVSETLHGLPSGCGQTRTENAA